MSDSISRQAAIDMVRDVCDAIMSGCDSYYDPETGDEVYKDILEVNAILKCNKEIRIALRNMPSAEPEIIKCKDCKHSFLHNNGEMTSRICGRTRMCGTTPDDWYCADAERRMDG